MQAQQGLIKENEFVASETKQEYDYWCVYACLESIESSSSQCEACDSYINDYLTYSSNPYGSLMSDDDFDEVMALYMNENSPEKPCDSPEKFGDFGVVGKDLNDFLKDNNLKQVDAEHLIICILQKPEVEVSSAYLLVENNLDGAGHCVVLSRSEYYNNSWNDPNSHLYIMDPATGNEEEIDYVDL